MRVKAMTAIPIDSYGKKVRIPLGDLAGSVNLDEEVEVTIRGKVSSLEAARKKGEEYPGDRGRPAEITIDISEVTFNNKTNKFTKMSRDLDKMETGYVD
jgi:hypothetical protein